MSKPDPIHQIAINLIDEAVNSERTSPPLDPASVHDLRVLSKKLRALLYLYLPYLDKALIKRRDKQLKQLADSYALSRDSDVLQETLAQLLKHNRKSKQHDELSILRDYFAELAVTAEPDSHADPRQQLSAIAQDWPRLRQAKSSPDLSEGIDSTYRKARKLSQRASQTTIDDDYHRCRKWLKYYLYQLELAGLSLNKDDQKHHRQLRKLGTRLGLLHDLCVLEKQLQALCETDEKDETVETVETVETKKNRQPLNNAITIALDWLGTQKNADKAACEKLFVKVFGNRHSPVIH